MAPGDMELPGGMKVSASGAMAGGGAGGPPMGKHFSADHPPTQADIAQMRAMAEKMKGGAQ
jgi:hypothetical protein